MHILTTEAHIFVLMCPLLLLPFVTDVQPQCWDYVGVYMCITNIYIWYGVFPVPEISALLTASHALGTHRCNLGQEKSRCTVIKLYDKHNINQSIC